MRRLLEAAERKGKPLLFGVVVGASAALRRHAAWRALRQVAASAFGRAEWLFPLHEHGYTEGHAHIMRGGTRESKRMSSCVTAVSPAPPRVPTGVPPGLPPRLPHDCRVIATRLPLDCRCDTAVFVWATSAAAAQWPATAEVEALLRRAMKATIPRKIKQKATKANREAHAAKKRRKGRPREG